MDDKFPLIFFLHTKLSDRNLKLSSTSIMKSRVFILISIKY